MVCQSISNIESLADLVVFPTTCDYFFYLKLLGVMMFIVAWGLFKSEEKRTGKGDLVPSLAVSSIAFLVVALIGTLVKSTTNIPMIQGEILLYFVAICIVFVLIWIFKE